MRPFYRKRLLTKICSALVLLVGLILHSQRIAAQGKELLINLGPLDGFAITPENIFSFAIQSGLSTTTDAVVNGTLRYRQSGLSLSYSFRMAIRPGMNVIDPASIHPQWNYSSAAFRELFADYHRLPVGTYEYCVRLTPGSSTGEQIAGTEVNECLYQKSEDIFLINLVDPENNAKLYEHNPVFSWIVNYPFASQLTYRIRVAPIKHGQNTAGAIVRNNPIYQERDLPQTTTTYPVYGTPLETFQPYAWTVDAYYKGILLGGAEPWKFTIVEDSLLVGIPRDVSYLDIRKEHGGSRAFAIGKLKLKYVLEDLKSDSLALRLTYENSPIKLDRDVLPAQQGDNRYELDFYNVTPLKHLKTYTLEISSQTGERYTVQFKYVNPDFL